MFWRVSKTEAAARRSSKMESGDHSNAAIPKSLMSRGKILQRIFLIFAVLWVSVVSAFAQDIITLKNGDDIKALVQEIGEVEVKYKKYDNPNGPNYTLKKSEVFMIRYANGSKDVFADSTSSVSTKQTTVTEQPGKFVCEGCDVIRLKNNMEIHVLNLEIGESDVRFKKADYSSGTVYFLKKYEIATIIYSDGKKEDFTAFTLEPATKGRKNILGVDKRSVATNEKLFHDFDNRMNICGFKKRIIVWDFLTDDAKYWLLDTYDEKNSSKVGLWLNYQKKLVAFRLNGESWNEMIVPIDIIKSIEVVEDGFKKTTGTAMGDWFVVSNYKTKDFATEVKLRIVMTDINTGPQSFFLILFPKISGGRIIKTSDRYKGIVECTRSIYDEFDFMANQ